MRIHQRLLMISEPTDLLLQIVWQPTITELLISLEQQTVSLSVSEKTASRYYCLRSWQLIQEQMLAEFR
ncbi:hypothetical protein D9M69_587240 [compost metagenome]